jgi:hypothetical protein
MAQAINGVQQAATDRATRIAQILEQRHLQTEMAAAAFSREDTKRSAAVSESGESFQAKPGEREDGSGPGYEPGARKKRQNDTPPPSPDGSSGNLVDVSA